MRVRLTGSLVLPGSIDAVRPLFTAEGESRWVPGWDPSWADDDHQHEIGEVWTTAGPPSTTWVTVDASADRVRYARVAPGDSAGLVTVSFAEDRGQTRVTVDYDLTALSQDGAQRLERFAPGYPDMLAEWRAQTSLALAKATEPEAPTSAQQ